jgi:hypothetical protein
MAIETWPLSASGQREGWKNAGRDESSEKG